jgi:hypothetical protein
MTPELARLFQQSKASGQAFTERGFTSTSAFSPEQQLCRRDLTNKFFTRNTYIAIRSKSGRLVRQFLRNSSTFKDEWEVLFCYDTKFRVLSFEDTTPGLEVEAGERGRYRIVMEEVQSRIPGLETAQLNEE